MGGTGSGRVSQAGRARGRARQNAATIGRTTQEGMNRTRPATRARLTTTQLANRVRRTAAYANARVNRRRRRRPAAR